MQTAAPPNAQATVRNQFVSLVRKHMSLDLTNVPEGADLVEDLNLDSIGLATLAALLSELGAPAGERALRDFRSLGEVYEHLENLPLGDEMEPPAALQSDRGREVHGPPSRSGKFFRLEPIQADAIPYLYRLAISEEIGFRWRYRGTIPPYEAFQAAFWEGVVAQFLVVSSETSEAAGHVVCYDVEANSGHAHIGAVFDTDYMHAGIAVDAVAVFVRYLFATYSLRKLYLDVPGFNYELISSGAGRFFQVEGTLRGHDYYNGTFWDKYVLAIYRDDALDILRS